MEQDPEYRARRDELDSERAAQFVAREKACEPVVADLRSHGVNVESLWDLFSAEPYPTDAIPVLLTHLQRNYPEQTLSFIGDALPVKPAVPWWDDLKSLYLATRSDAVRGRMAASMSQCAVAEHYDDLLTFISNPSLGESRIYFLGPIDAIGNRIKAGEGRKVVQSVADDPTLGIRAAQIIEGNRGFQ